LGLVSPGSMDASMVNAIDAMQRRVTPKVSGEQLFAWFATSGQASDELNCTERALTPECSIQWASWPNGSYVAMHGTSEFHVACDKGHRMPCLLLLSHL
jgi:hypothetical protein